MFTCNGGRRHPLIVVGVHTHAVVLQVEGKLTELHVFQLVLMKVGPTPQTGVDHMRETLPTCHLQEDRQVRGRQTDRQTGERQTDRQTCERQTDTDRQCGYLNKLCENKLSHGEQVTMETLSICVCVCVFQGIQVNL